MLEAIVWHFTHVIIAYTEWFLKHDFMMKLDQKSEQKVFCHPLAYIESSDVVSVLP